MWVCHNVWWFGFLHGGWPDQSNRCQEVSSLCFILDRQSDRTDLSVNTVNLNLTRNQKIGRMSGVISQQPMNVGRFVYQLLWCEGKTLALRAGCGQRKTLTLPHRKGQTWVRRNRLELQGECFRPPFLSSKLLSFRECVEGSCGQKERTKEREAQQGRDTEGERNQKWRRGEGNNGLWLRENSGSYFPFLLSISN